MAKTQNYTAEQVSALTQAYTAADTQEARDAVIISFAEKFGRNVNSIRAKLTYEGVYIKKERTRKNGTKSIRKAQKMVWIAAALDTTVDNVEDLEKLTHKTLDLLIKKMDIS